MIAYKCVKGLENQNLRFRMLEKEVYAHNIGDNVIHTVLHINISKQQAHETAHIILDCIKEIM